MIGIYKLCYKDKFYYGSSTDVGRRFRTHKYKLKKGTHDNKQLQAIVNKHGIEAISFEVLAQTATIEVAREWEQTLLDDWQGHELCMNHRNTATGFATGDAHPFKEIAPPNRKLTMEQAEDIRRRIANKEISMRKIAKEYGVTHGVISLIVRGKTYTTARDR